MKDLKPGQKDEVRLGTLWAIRSRDACRAAHSKGVPWINENPPEVENGVSPFGLDEWIELTSRACAHRNLIDQCQFGAEYKKATEFQGSIDLKGEMLKCNHDPQWWRTPPSGT